MSAAYAPVRIVFRGYRMHGRKLTEHDGAFPSYNDIGGSGRNQKGFDPIYNVTKQLWSKILYGLLSAPTGTDYEFIKPDTKTTKVIVPVERDGELPEGCGLIMVEGKAFWPDLRLRDQNNYTTTIAKFLGDVLELHGYLRSHDDWLSFQFGNLQRGLNRTVPAYTELYLLPSPDRLELDDEGAAPPSRGLF